MPPIGKGTNQSAAGGVSKRKREKASDGVEMAVLLANRRSAVWDGTTGEVNHEPHHFGGWKRRHTVTFI